MKVLPIIATTLTLALAPSALALTATQTVLKEVRTQSASGEETIDYVEAKLVIPGETVVYRLDYFNDASEPVTDMVLTMPVPAEVEYLDGSADRDGATTLYSTDGGETFATRDAVTRQQPGGETAPALASDITHVRWMFTVEVPPGEAGDISFKGRLK